MPLETPVAFCIFNRPQLTQQVFEVIANAQPKKLLVIADGPRSENIEDELLVQQTRAVIEQVDWDCEVIRHFSDVNLGCKQRMATGIDWAFSQSEELIILEDDCLPDPSFFKYCQRLLKHYRDDERVMMISGDNFQPEPWSTDSYYFSRWPHIWGWATWKRAWQHFDVEVSSWPKAKANRDLVSVFGSEAEYEYWASVLDRQHAGEIDTWDFPWAYACWLNRGLTILPETNLIQNIGFGASATHTTDVSSKLSNLKTGPIQRLHHPENVAPNQIADDYTWKNILAPPAPPVSKLKSRRKKWYHRFTRTKVA